MCLPGLSAAGVWREAYEVDRRDEVSAEFEGRASRQSPVQPVVGRHRSTATGSSSLPPGGPVPATLRAAQKAAEAFLRSNRKEREEALRLKKI
jgi:hypothetical protein